MRSLRLDFLCGRTWSFLCRSSKKHSFVPATTSIKWAYTRGEKMRINANHGILRAYGLEDIIREWLRSSYVGATTFLKFKAFPDRARTPLVAVRGLRVFSVAATVVLIDLLPSVIENTSPTSASFLNDWNHWCSRSQSMSKLYCFLISDSPRRSLFWTSSWLLYLWCVFIGRGDRSPVRACNQAHWAGGHEDDGGRWRGAL